MVPTDVFVTTPKQVKANKNLLNENGAFNNDGAMISTLLKLRQTNEASEDGKAEKHMHKDGFQHSIITT